MSFSFKDINLYESIKEFQEYQNLIKYPIDLNFLCDKNGWLIDSYSTKNNFTFPQNGFSLYKKNTYFIFYNTYMNCKGRIRFTIAHEIGHIVLNHHFLSDYEENKDEIEKQADYFAANILLPAVILKENYHLTKNINFLKEYFLLSEKCIQNRLDFSNFWNEKIKYNNNFRDKILSVFEEDITIFENDIMLDYKNKYAYSALI